MTTTTPSEEPKEPVIVVDDDPDIVDSRKVQFESWSRLDHNPDALRIYFELTSPDVTGAHATVVEDPSRVEVTLHIGGKPGTGPIHTDLAYIAGLDVRLGEPLGNRKVLSVF
ncbi:hypothetical protein [Mycobacterium sp. OTB74]|uniref:hypothetical protein n=1 Tax=Mycobacterium sp. OTB74 TaxID=1853452 RepID=UPI002473A14F|nr:hypothetical protein [Mycobacterium sp. OTB74]MDH6247754.1 hypothetical protein [Mycobacterium sp. OTB74]